VNILGLTYDYDQGFLNDDSVAPFSINLYKRSKKIIINEKLSFALGTQIGFHSFHSLASYIYK
jgi:hypothetical protein